MNKPILYIFSGIPACGKTTFSRRFIQGTSIKYVSRDEIRFSIVKEGEDYFSHEKEVFQKFVSTISQNLTDGFDVIADATHLNKSSRQKLIRAIDTNFGKLYDIMFVYFNTRFEICCGRNEKREGRFRVPDSAMSSMRANFQKPSMLEDKRCIGLMLIKGE